MEVAGGGSSSQGGRPGLGVGGGGVGWGTEEEHEEPGGRPAARGGGRAGVALWGWGFTVIGSESEGGGMRVFLLSRVVSSEGGRGRAL